MEQIIFISSILLLHFLSYKNFEEVNIPTKVELDKEIKISIHSDSSSDYVYFPSLKNAFTEMNNISIKANEKYLEKIKKNISTIDSKAVNEPNQSVEFKYLIIRGYEKKSYYISALTIGLIPLSLNETHTVVMKVKNEKKELIHKEKSYSSNVKYSPWFIFLPYFYDAEHVKDQLLINNSLKLLEEYNNEIKTKQPTPKNR